MHSRLLKPRALSVAKLLRRQGSTLFNNFGNAASPLRTNFVAALPLASSQALAATASWEESRRKCHFALTAGAVLATGLAGLLSDNTTTSQCQAEEVRSPDRVFTRAEVAKHKTVADGVWVTFGDDVFDITEFLPSHPGGTDKLMQAAGGPVEPFWNLYRTHYSSSKATDILSKHRIGVLHPDDIAAKEREYVEESNPYANEPPVSDKLRIHQLDPARAEPPPPLLCQSWISPTDLMFIRNHHPVPLFENVDADYKITVKIPIAALDKRRALDTGMDKPADANGPKSIFNDEFKEVTYTLGQLKQLFGKHSVVSSIQCGGNRRAVMDEYGDSGGIAWDVGAIHTGRWGGVLLRDVLLHAGLDQDEYLLSGKEEEYCHCQFASSDGLMASIPLDKAFAPKGDVLLAFELNNEPIPEMFGFPLRAVIPGHVGVRNVKWVESVIVAKEESKGTWQRGVAYKGLGPSTKNAKGIDIEKVQSLQEQPVNSAITSHVKGQKLKPGKNTLRGYAYSGGGRGIVRVDVSVDGGENWTTATLKEGSHQPMHRAWAWTLWECDVDLPKSDNIELICKATDASYNVQPDSVKAIWNLRGINNNAWHRVKVSTNNSE